MKVGQFSPMKSGVPRPGDPPGVKYAVDSENELFTKDQAAAMMDISIRKLFTLMQTGKIKFVKMAGNNGRVRFTRRQIAEAIDTLSKITQSDIELE